MADPVFDPNKPSSVVEGAAPAFDPNKPSRVVQTVAPTPVFNPNESSKLVEGDRTWLGWAADKAVGAVDVATDIGEGIISGVVSLGQGLAELPALAIDAAFDTNTLEAVDTVFKPVREFVAPETTAGKIVEDVTAFGVGFLPFVGWLGRAGQVARGTRTAGQLAKGTGLTSAFMRSADNFGSSAAGRALLGSKARMIGTTALAAGAYDTMLSPDGRATISDQFSVMPDILKTEQDTGLTGRDEALRRVRNRLRSGAEAATLSAGFDVALAGAGAATRELAKVPQVAAAANAFSDGLERASTSIATRFPKATALAKEYLTPSGGANRILYEEVEDAKAIINDAKKRATDAASEYDKELQDVLKISGVDGKTKAKIIQDEVTQYLEGLRTDLPSIGDAALQKRVTNKLDRMIDISTQYVDDLMGTMERAARSAEPGTPRAKLAEEAIQALNQTRASQGMHLRRTFEQYKNPVKFYKELDLTSPAAKAAINDVAANIASMEGRAATDPEILTRAKDVVLRSLDLGREATTKGMSDKQLVDMRLAAAKDATAGKGRLGSLVAKERPEFITDKGLFIEQEDILTRSPQLRALKGEVTDPMQRYLNTIEDTVRTMVADRFYRELPTLGLEKSLFDAIPEINSGKRPSVVSVPDFKSMTNEQYEAAMAPFAREAADVNAAQGRMTSLPQVDAVSGPRPGVDRITRDDLVEQYKSRLRQEGYVQLGEAAGDDVFGGLYGAGSGKFVSPETYRAITQPLRLSQTGMGEVLAALSTFRNITQKMTIVPNPASQVRNIFGNVGFLAGNANLPNGGDLSDLFYTFVKSLDEIDDAGLERMARKLTLTGNRDVNLVTKALKEYRAAAEDLTANGRLTATLDKAEGFIPFMRQFEALYSNSDSFFKGAALAAEEASMADILAKAGINELDPRFIQSLVDNGLLARPTSQMIEDLTPLELMAAEVVKDTMPTYNRVVKAVKLTDAVPIIGNFTSFAAENIRNSIGTVMRGVKETAYEAGPALRQAVGDTKADILEQQIRARGAQRLLAYTSMAYILPKSLVKMSMAATGTTPEQMAALYEMNPDFLNGHDLVILENNKQKGYIDFIDLSYVMPYAFMTDPASAAVRQYQESGRADKSMISSAANAIFDGFKVFADPFASETMFYERLRDVMPQELLFGRGGETATGALIYGPNEDPMSKGSKIFNHLVMGFAPNYVGLLAEERAGQMQYGRLVRAVSGVPDRQGEVTNTAKEIGRLVTGFTPMRLNMKTDARYKGSEYIPLRSDSRSRVNAALKDATITPQGVTNAWNQYLNELYRAQSKLFRDVEAMRTLGMTDDQIRYALINQAGLGASEANGIIDGRFTPSEVSKETAADIRDQLTRDGRVRLLEEIDFDSLIKRVEERVGEPLRSAPQGGVFNAPAPNVPQFDPNAPSTIVPEFNPAAPSTVVPQRQGFVLPPVAPVLAPGTRTAAVSPALLGETPAEQAANAQIVQRIG